MTWNQTRRLFAILLIAVLIPPCMFLCEPALLLAPSHLVWTAMGGVCAGFAQDLEKFAVEVSLY